jgi:hypothetical protein
VRASTQFWDTASSPGCSLRCSTGSNSMCAISTPHRQIVCLNGIHDGCGATRPCAQHWPWLSEPPAAFTTAHAVGGMPRGRPPPPPLAGSCDGISPGVPCSRLWWQHGGVIIVMRHQLFFSIKNSRVFTNEIYLCFRSVYLRMFQHMKGKQRAVGGKRPFGLLIIKIQ